MPKKLKTILLVEDEEVLVDLYKIKFENEGFKVIVANNGKEGVEMALKKKPDIVLLDIVMPVKDGYHALKELRKNSATAKMKIYILSNLGQPDEIKQGLNLGADGYLVKANLTPAQLVEYVTSVLNGKKIKSKGVDDFHTNEKIKLQVLIIIAKYIASQQS